MPKQMIEIDIPEGYEFLRFDVPKENEYYISHGNYIAQAKFDWSDVYAVIVKPSWIPPAFLKPGWIVRDKCSWRWHACEPVRNSISWVSGGSELDLTHINWDPPPCANWQDSKRRIP